MKAGSTFLLKMKQGRVNSPLPLTEGRENFPTISALNAAMAAVDMAGKAAGNASKTRSAQCSRALSRMWW